MEKEDLRKLLDAEVASWAEKPFEQLIAELDDVVAYGRNEGDAAFHQFEIMPLERKDAYIHVSVSIDDGTLWRSFSPLSRDFIVYRDGRVEI